MHTTHSPSPNIPCISVGVARKRLTLFKRDAVFFFLVRTRPALVVDFELVLLLSLDLLLLSLDLGLLLFPLDDMFLRIRNLNVVEEKVFDRLVENQFDKSMQVGILRGYLSPGRVTVLN